MAPLALAGAAAAQVSISSGTTTPVATATANNGAPSDVDIASGGSVGLTVPGVAVTLNSNNNITNEGEIGSTDINGSTGLQILGGYTGSYTQTGTILMTETYTASTNTNDGLLTGPYAQGQNRIGLQVIGPGVFNGPITLTGSVTVNGNDSIGVDIEAPITGALVMQTISPTTFTASTASSVVVTNGSINMLGDNNIGLYVAPTGGVGGNLTIGSVSATGHDSQAVVVNGSVGGTLSISGTVTSTGYRITTRGTDPSIEAQYLPVEIQQGGVAVTVGGNVAGGMILSTVPLLTSSTNPDLDGNGVPDIYQTSGEIVSYGQSPALQLGVAGQSGGLGLLPAGAGVSCLQTTGDIAPCAANTYGLAIQGQVIGNGVFDPVTETDAVKAPISGTAIVVGTGSASTPFTIQGGIFNTGLIEGIAYQASATGIHFIAGGSTPLIVNNGFIFATSTQITTGAGAQGYSPVNVYGIVIDPGATVGSIVNNSSILAELTGSGGAGATEIGAIVDRSGTLSNITNTGAIVAEPNQTVLSTQMPVGSVVAIDTTAGTGPQVLTQQTNSALPTSAPYSQTTTYTVGQFVSYENEVYEALTTVSTAQDPVDYPTEWRPIGAVSPSIVGNVLLGSGGTTVNVYAGSISSGVINLGTGANTINIAGASGSGVTGVSVSGAIEEAPATAANVAAGFTNSASLQASGSGRLTININNGTLTDLNPNVMTANAVNVGANGQLIVSADPVNGTNTRFVTSGASTFAQGAQVGIQLLSLPKIAQETFVILQTTGAGTLSSGTFAQNAVGNAPFLFYANPTYVPGAGGGGQIDVTVTEKTAAQLGFNTAEGDALNAVLSAASQNSVIQNALLAQTTQSGLRSVYDQLLPNQGQGLFEALDAAMQQVSTLTASPPDNGHRVAGTSLWLQEVNEQVARSGVDSPGSYAKLAGVVGGWEHLGVTGGALGMTFSYFNDAEIASAAQLGSGVVANLIEASLYYRRSIGGFTFGARGGIGGAFFDSDRVFLAPGTRLDARAHYTGIFYEGHALASYQQGIGRFYIRPELAADYLDLHEGAYQETGGGPGFDLAVGSQNNTRLTGSALMAVGRNWGKESWVQSEVRFGVREVLAGSLGDTEAAFDSGSPFLMTPDSDKGGWITAGFSLRAGSPNSYFALEGDADYRNGEQRYDIRIAGRSIF